MTPAIHSGYTGGMFSSQKEALTSSYEAILRVHVVHAPVLLCTNDLVHVAAEVMVRTNYSTPVYRAQHDVRGHADHAAFT